MRYPILRSNSKLSFASQGCTRLGRSFRIEEAPPDRTSSFSRGGKSRWNSTSSKRLLDKSMPVGASIDGCLSVQSREYAIVNSVRIDRYTGSEVILL